MAFLRGFGSYLPERIVDNEEVAGACGVEPGWILAASGIRERRYAAEGETVAGVATKAAQDCLTRCGVEARELAMVIVASGSAERFCPGPAATVAAELGCAGVLALDVPVASAGSLMALAIAAQFADRVGPQGKLLVVGAEIMSRRVERTPAGKNTAILFGDGAGAALVDATSGPLRIVDFALHTDGSQAEILKVEGERLHMDGGSVILQAARKIPAVAKELLDRNSVAAEALSAVIMHQANLNLIARVAKTLVMPEEKFFVNIERYGNTSSASLLIAAAEWWQATGKQASGTMLLAAFGAGLNWGAMLMERTSESA